MPPVRFLPGTHSPGTPSVYTDAQWAAMNAVYQTELRLRYRAAKPEFVNKVMLADGSISTDLDAVRAAARDQHQREPGSIDELEAHIAEKRFLIIVDCDLVPRIYFQCAVQGNPDIEILSDAPTEV